MDAHGDHFRKPELTVPYLAHLLGAASTVLEAGGSEQEAILALLHDVVEDQPLNGSGRARLEDVRTRFGARIADGIEALSDWISEGPDDKKDDGDKEARKRAYRERLAAERDKSVLLVSAADKLNNARAMEDDRALHLEEMWERLKKSTPEQIIDNYRNLIDIYRNAAAHDDRMHRIVIPLGATIERLSLRLPPGGATAATGDSGDAGSYV